MKPINLIAFLAILFISNVQDLPAQQYLLIEKSGNPRTERIKIYDELTFQLKNEDIWYTRQILGLNADAQLIQVGDTWLPLSDLTRIKLKRQRAWSNIIGGALQGGGASMILSDLWFTIRNQHYLTDGGWEFGLVNIGVGTLVRSVFSPIKYKLGNKHRHRLRIVDLTF